MNPRKTRKRRPALFVLAALPLTAGLVLAAGTAAQSAQTPQTPQQAQPAQPGGTPTQPRQQPSGTDYAEVFLQKLAAQLGISVERLRAAAVAAGGATLDQAVGAGDLSVDRAAALKRRLQDAPLNFGFGRRGPGGHDHAGRGGRMDGGPRGSGHPHGSAENAPNRASGEGTT